MDRQQSKPGTIDEYIAGFPVNVQNVLEEVRRTVRDTIPDATECISYAIPTFKLNNTNLVHFAAFKNHIGFYPAPTGMEAFKHDFAGYQTGKGSVQFPLNEPMPLELIARIVKFRTKEVT
ncbi:MAG TPA: DUF1801 domain-containing protein [Sphingobacteriaceae bacterium]